MTQMHDTGGQQVTCFMSENSLVNWQGARALAAELQAL